MKYKIAFSLAIISSLITIIFVIFLPEQIPSHFNLSGEIDGIESKYYLFILPLLNWILFVCLLFAGEKDEFINNILICLGEMFFIGLEVFVIFRALSESEQVNTLLLQIVGLFVSIAGFGFCSTSQNRFLGIKNKWTMSDSYVWNKTNRFGRLVFPFVGISIIVLSFIVSFQTCIIVLVVLLFIATIILNIYSYSICSQMG